MRLRLLVLAAFLAAAAIACGGGGSDPATPTPTGAVTVRIVASERLFDRATIHVPADSRITIELLNQDADPHNFAVYESTAAEQEIFVSDTIAVRGKMSTGSFDAPPPGTYFFRCDVHPVTMTGELIVG